MVLLNSLLSPEIHIRSTDEAMSTSLKLLNQLGSTKQVSPNHPGRSTLIRSTDWIYSELEFLIIIQGVVCFRFTKRPTQRAIDWRFA